MSFDDIIDRRGSHCVKWDMMEKLYGVPKDDGIAMWVADMDFKPPQWWMKTRHGWDVDPDWVFTTHGLVNGTAMCVDAFTAPGDGIVLFTPVYHAFAKVINAAERKVVECQLVNNAGRYEMDFDAYDAQMTGAEKMVILCSPHNPGGRVWTKAELEQVAAFAKRHDLVLVSDEIHHDLVFGENKHTAMSHIDGIKDRLVMMTATTKTFNIAGSHSGNVIIEDDALRAKFGARMMALGLSPNSFGLFMATAAYSPEGAAWVDELNTYLTGNKELFDAAVNAIPGLKSMNLEATYLAWVDFEGTGMDRQEFTDRVQGTAKIAVNHGPTFGTGGESFLRFNIATPRSVVQEACDRLAAAFSDLQ